MFRFYLLRAMDVFITVGLAVQKWPGILNPPADLAYMGSVLGAVTFLAVLGIRYPLRRLPLLFFELVWKSISVLMWGRPLWPSHQLTPDRRESLIACLVGIVLVPLVMPWGYVLNQYVKAPGAPWRKQVGSSLQSRLLNAHNISPHVGKTSPHVHSYLVLDRTDSGCDAGIKS